MSIFKSDKTTPLARSHSNEHWGEGKAFHAPPGKRLHRRKLRLVAGKEDFIFLKLKRIILNNPTGLFRQTLNFKKTPRGASQFLRG
jgi:hypothetical protein